MAPSTLRWGIVATGWISSKFCLDLLVDPATRDVSDVKHVITAVASRSTAKAGAFVEDVWKEAGVTEGKDKVKLFGSYDEIYASKDVDVLYIGTPHSHHYQNVLAALNAGKSVLCEKSLTVNGDQAATLVTLARSKGLFFMEAVWTRFQPVSYKVQEIIRSGAIGELRSVQAELSVNLDEKTRDPSHRMVNPTLAGGALLDLGPYPWTWLALLLLPAAGALKTPCAPLKLSASILKGPTGVDHSTVAAIQFPQEDGRVLHGTLTTGLEAQTTPSRVVVAQGSKGYLEIHWATYRPDAFTYSSWDTEADYGTPGKAPSKTETFKFDVRPRGIWGFAWEADEVARCIRDGKTESERMPLRETVLMMRTFDEIRKQGGLDFPEEIMTLEKRDL